MRILGIDYGRAKIGLAISEGKLAEPWKVVKITSVEDVIEKVVNVVKVEEVEKAVVGISEGKMGQEAKDFSLNLRKRLEIPVEIYDETLTTYNAKLLSRTARVKRVKRKALEDAYAAALMLQAYLDSN